MGQVGFSPGKVQVSASWSSQSIRHVPGAGVCLQEQELQACAAQQHAQDADRNLPGILRLHQPRI